MKRLLQMLAVGSMLAMSGFSATTSFFCTTNGVQPPNSGTGSITVAGLGSITNGTLICPSFSVLPTEQISQVQLDYFSSFNQNTTGGTVTSSFVYTAPGGFLPAGDLGVVVSSAGLIASATTIPAGIQVLAGGTQSFSSFNVLIDIGVTGPVGFIGNSDGSVRVTYTYDTIPQGGDVPEPTSLALMGAGLLAVGAIARRRK